MSAGGPKHWGLFGGAGFIGQHLALSILERNPQDRVALLDLVLPDDAGWKVPLAPHLGTDRLTVMACDVREASLLGSIPARFDVIVNLAAVHREPGHRPVEYFETNVAGAENLCKLAQATGCAEIIFTSSISVYGIHDRPVDETTQVQPKTPYGRSKHEAEQVHVDWARESGGRLTIIRPGVVFGPGEAGNVTRLVREMLKRDRVIRLEPDQAKAGIYIKELIDLLHWLRAQDHPTGSALLVNGVSSENLTFNAFGRALEQVRPLAGKPLVLPAKLVRAASAMLRPLAPLISANSRMHPERLAKIYRPNDIRSEELARMGYPFAWPLPRALADWLEHGL